MKILITSEPGLSHANAIIPFAIVLQGAGHEMLLAGPPSSVAAFRDAGVRGRSIVLEPLSSSHPSLAKELPQLRDAQPNERMRVSRLEVSVRRRAVSLAKALPQLVEDWRPDLVLRDATELGGWAIAERFHLPHASIEVGQHWTPEDWYGSNGAAISALREAAGLSTSDYPPQDLYRYLHIGTSPPGFLGPNVTVPRVTRTVRPTFHDSYNDSVVPESLGDAAYMAFGTIYPVDEDVVRRISTKLADLFPQVLASGTFEPPSQNVTVAKYIPQSMVMPQCKVVVCHGGRNTVLTALAAGVPLVCVPVASDQFITSERVTSLGVGLSSTWDVEEVTAAVVEVSRSNHYRVCAERMASQIQAMPDVSSIVSAVEALRS